MRVSRMPYKETTVYMADPNGKAEMSVLSFRKYVLALDEIAAFEREVDRQYENQSPSSAPSTR